MDLTIQEDPRRVYVELLQIVVVKNHEGTTILYKLSK